MNGDIKDIFSILLIEIFSFHVLVLSLALARFFPNIFGHEFVDGIYFPFYPRNFQVRMFNLEKNKKFPIINLILERPFWVLIEVSLSDRFFVFCDLFVHFVWKLAFLTAWFSLLGRALWQEYLSLKRSQGYLLVGWSYSFTLSGLMTMDIINHSKDFILVWHLKYFDLLVFDFKLLYIQSILARLILKISF